MNCTATTRRTGVRRTALGQPYLRVTDSRPVPLTPTNTLNNYAHWAPRQELTSWRYPNFDCVAASWTSQYDVYVGGNSTSDRANLDMYKRCVQGCWSIACTSS
jgi:hypothetical protein